MSWKTVALGDICIITGGGTPSKSNLNFYIGDIPWATVRDMNRDYLEETDFKISKEAVKQSSTNVIPKNNVVIATRVGLGKVCILKQDTAINQDLRGIVPKSDNLLDVNYLFYWFKSISKIIVDAGRGATVHGVTLPFIKSLQIPLPPISIQIKIVAKLDAIFAEIDKAKSAAEANADNAEALFQSYLTEVFENKKFDFKLVKFGTTAGFVRGPFGGSLKKSIFVEKGYAVYEQQHAIYNQFSDVRYFIDKIKFEEMKRFELKSGDLIMSCSGTMGKIAIVPENIEQGIINQALLKITPSKNVMGEYIARLLSSKYFQDILTKLSGGAAIQNVPAVSVLKDIEVPVPSITNQKLIVDIIDVLESNKSIIKNSYKAKSKELASLNQSILQQAFSGELVRD